MECGFDLLCVLCVSAVNVLPHRKRRSAAWWREARDGYLFALPWLLGFFLFTLGPTLASILMSFTRWDGITPISRIQWVGAENYAQLVSDEHFHKALWNTAWYVMWAVP